MNLERRLDRAFASIDEGLLGRLFGSKAEDPSALDAYIACAERLNQMSTHLQGLMAEERAKFDRLQTLGGGERSNGRPTVERSRLKMDIIRLRKEIEHQKRLVELTEREYNRLMQQAGVQDGNVGDYRRELHNVRRELEMRSKQPAPTQAESRDLLAKFVHRLDAI